MPASSIYLSPFCAFFLHIRLSLLSCLILPFPPVALDCRTMIPPPRGVCRVPSNTIPILIRQRLPARSSLSPGILTEFRMANFGLRTLAPVWVAMLLTVVVRSCLAAPARQGQAQESTP